MDEASASNTLGPAPHAIALRAHVDDTAELCAAEKSLLREWLERPTEL
ncbi:hypothetical protein [Aurantiacibacter suaedae]|nr:hypothetical protein [Aurantiacibacter suaedae]